MKKSTQKSKSKPTRLCAACRCRAPKESLIRIVKNGDVAQVDLKHRMDGRGAYICQNVNCLKVAMKRHAIERSLAIEAQDKLYDELKAILNV